MKALATIIIIFLCRSIAFATGTIEPKEGHSYSAVNKFNVKEYSDGTCLDEKSFQVCTSQKFKVTSIEGQTIIIKITGDVGCGESQAITGDSYCMDKAKFTSANVEEVANKVKSGVAVVAFAVPMKFDFRTYKVYPGGEIGGALGYRMRFRDKPDGSLNAIPTYSTSLNVIAFGGFTTIPLNDVNSNSATEISSVGGFSWGFGVGYTFNGGVQLGAYMGNDYYSFGGTKYRNPWISIGVGYEFIRIFDNDRR